MEQNLFNDLVQSLKEAKAISKGLAKPSRQFTVNQPDKLTAETLGKSERGEDVHSAKDADELFKQLGI